ncbi:MAG: cyclic nucleotide-binding domain-containing protein, partial [Solirubrobacteraceae bacterium]
MRARVEQMTVGARRVPRGPLATALLADLLISCGNWGFEIALVVTAFRRGGASAVALMAAARLLPAMLAAPISGRLLDRLDRGRIVVTTCSVQAICFGGGALLILEHSPLPLIALFTVGGSVTSSAPRPALQTLIPALADTPDEVTRAVGLWSMAENGGALIGSGLGGLAIALVGTGAIAGGAAAVIGIAVALAIRLPAVRATTADDAPGDAGLSGVLAGARAVARSPLLRGPFVLFMGLLLLEGTTNVQLVALAIGRLHLGNGGPGALLTVWGVSGTLGAVVLLRLVRRRGYGLALSVGGLGFGVFVAVAGLGDRALALASMVPLGLGFALIEAGVMAIIPRLVDDALVGRVYGLMEMIYSGGAAAGALIAPALISLLGVGGSMVLVGSALAALTVLLLPVLGRLDLHQERAARVRDLLRAIPCFSPLPLPRLERLVQEAQPLHVPAGATLIRAGERGDAFYALERGEVEIVEFQRLQGPGSGVGEIALLRDV